MSNLSICLLLTGIFLISWPLAVQGQALCISRSDMAKELLEQFQEVPISIGLAGNKIIEIFASPRGKTFTIVFTTQQGITCPIVAGENWMNFPFPAKDGLNILQQGQPNG
jgi:hypothetical protein